MSTLEPTIRLGFTDPTGDRFVLVDEGHPLDVYVDDLICASLRTIGDEVLIELWPRTPDEPEGTDGGTHLLARDIDKISLHYEVPRAVEISRMLVHGFHELNAAGHADSAEDRAALVERAWRMLGCRTADD